MTAEEYLKEKTSFDVLTFEETVKLMSGFANLKKSEWCKEQREECADYIRLWYDDKEIMTYMFKGFVQEGGK